jgi:flagellar export protein FliJ
MKSFNFRLDRVLHLRHLNEQEQARKLADANQAADNARRASDASAARASAAAEQVAGAPTELRTAGTLNNLLLAVDAARRQLERDAAAHLAALADVETSQASFDGARRDRRALERLREDRKAEWRRDQDRAEQQRVDEIALRQDKGERR